MVGGIKEIGERPADVDVLHDAVNDRRILVWRGFELGWWTAAQEVTSEIVIDWTQIRAAVGPWLPARTTEAHHVG